MEKKSYDVAESVAWVNGAPTPANRKVLLTEAEAAFDLGLGRIKLSAPAKGKAPD